MGFKGIQRTVLGAAVAIAAGTAIADDKDEATIVEPIDTVTIVGAQTELADIVKD